MSSEARKGCHVSWNWNYRQCKLLNMGVGNYTWLFCKSSNILFNHWVISPAISWTLRRQKLRQLSKKCLRQFSSLFLIFKPINSPSGFFSPRYRLHCSIKKFFKNKHSNLFKIIDALYFITRKKITMSKIKILSKVFNCNRWLKCNPNLMILALGHIHIH